MDSLFSASDLLTLLPGVVVIGLSVFIISNKNKVASFVKAVSSFLF